MSSSQTKLWEYLAPGDRETLMAGTVAWLMDPKGTHGYGGRILEWILDRLGFDPQATESAQIKVEQKSGRNRRFDIVAKNIGPGGPAVLEVKAKSFGSKGQLEKYEESGASVGRLGFGEWNWTLTEEDREKFRLVTFADIGKLLEDLKTERQKPRPLVDELRQFLVSETKFFADLHSYYIAEDSSCSSPPFARSDHRLSKRFYSQLYWRWFDKKRRTMGDDTESSSKAQYSGVWYILHERTHAGDAVTLPQLDIELPALAKSWVHVELFGNRSIHVDSDGEPIGKIQLRVQGEDESSRQQIWKALKQQTDAIQKAGFRIPRRRPSASASYWNPLTRALNHEDFRYSQLMRLIGKLDRQPV